MVLEAIADPDTPTFPSHITLEQAKNSTESMIKGDRERSGIVQQAIKGMVQSLIPH